jgi:HAMP domain-containing protein/signal transduction histidine kinase/ActR/RegA family two-component response regulator
MPAHAEAQTATRRGMPRAKARVAPHETDTEFLSELVRALVSASNGNRGVRLPARRTGIGGEIARAFNALASRQDHFASEVARVADVVRREGRTTARLRSKPSFGSWSSTVEATNALIDDLVRPTTEVTRVISAVAEGDLTQKVLLTIDGRPARGDIAEIGGVVNSMIDQLRTFSTELTRVTHEVGTAGHLGVQADVKGVFGIWRDLTGSVNSMAANLSDQVRDIALVTTAVANGDLSQKVTVDVRGELLELKQTVNSMVDQLRSFAHEVTRVAREVGTEGRLGGQADVQGVSGTWRDLTDSVNQLAGNLTGQVRNISQVTKAVALGDLSQKITVDARGEVAELKDTINTMVDQLSAFADEVTRVAREVGTDGKLGGQARVSGVAGTWRDLTDSVNFMAAKLTDQVRDIARVTTAVANGDLSQKIQVDVRGEIAELKDTINTMVDQLSSFAAEVTRVAREVGTEGRLGGQADVQGVSGTWKDLTDNVNQLAGNLTGQVRNIAQVTTAVARGDLSQKISVEAQGEVAELKDTINTMVDQLSAFAAEVTRVAREVGTEGRLGGQADVQGVSGTWRDLTDSVNRLAGNLTGQVRNIAQVTTAVAKGDLSQKITVDVSGEIAELKDTINTMVDQLSAFASEVTRVAREVGTEGKLGGQAEVKDVSGTWKDLTDNVNLLAGNLTSQVRNIAQVTTAVARGDLSQKITVDARGEVAQLKETVNTMVDQLSAFADEVTRVARDVGTEGRLGGQAIVPGVSGTWKDLTDNVNLLAGNLTGQVRNIAQVTTAVAKGDLSQKITVEVRGELLELKETVNTMVDQLSAFADEVTRVAREVGTEGRLGGQAEVKGVSGTWRDLTASVNSMADNLTDQVRNIAQVTTAVARGDLSQKITVPARGEILELKNTINQMVDQLQSFAAEVTRVAREVGTEGRLGGQAEVEGVSGTWARLTENVNQLAGNLTNQVRSIANVATAVTAGDLSRQITIDAPGELGDLKDNINQMIDNLRATTSRNEAQDWLNSNLARISATMQGQRNIKTLAQLIMSELTPLVGAQVGAFYLAVGGVDGTGEDAAFEWTAGFGAAVPKGRNRWRAGEGLVGQCALERKPILVDDVPKSGLRVRSGLVDAAASHVVVMPVLFEGRVLAVLELAALEPLPEVNRQLLHQIVETVGVALNTILATTRTEELLAQSQELTRELQSQSAELQRKQEELQHTNAEIELARGELEERAEQLSLSSRYKSEFLANMSHELRTPLNSLLILARMLADNPDGHLTEKEIGFAQSIYDSGGDLLGLINDILDLSRVEAGKLEVVMTPVSVATLCADVRQIFEPIAAEKNLQFELFVDPAVPETVVTDQQRVEQVLKNLLSNAFKFTERGGVELRIGMLGAKGRRAQLALVVRDTGIGIARDKQQLIFEAFQQADGTTSRRYGGTGLGLSISREIAHLLGGELHVESEVDEGSTFTLLLPLDVAPTVAHRTPRAPRKPPALAASGDLSAWDGTRVVVVDDDVRSLYALASALEARGMTVILADSGQQCLKVLESTPGIDMVLIDIMMPEMDGYETIRRIREAPDRVGLPVIAVTAKAMEADREASLSAGASDYITKPVDMEELLRLMRVWLQDSE